MTIEIKIPSVGESIQEALLAEWFKKDGDHVKKDEPLFVIETDKVTLEIEAETDGILRINVGAGATVAIGQVVGIIETKSAEMAKTETAQKEKKSFINFPSLRPRAGSLRTKISKIIQNS